MEHPIDRQRQLAEIDRLLKAPVDSSGGEAERPTVPLEPQTRRPVALRPGARFGPYTLVEVLGQGAMAQVYRAQNPKGELLALKVLDHSEPELLARFKREARILEELNHPNIVAILDHGIDDARPYIAMPIASGSLADRLANGPLSWREALDLIEQVAAAAAHAHELGVIHRDIKPGNILLSEEGEVWVSDFGLAFQSEASQRLTQGPMILGTPAYMAPEQAAGDDSAVGPQADVFAIGATLFHTLRGAPPHRVSGSNWQALVLLKSRQQDFRKIRDEPPGLKTVLDRCLIHHPGHRYRNAGELSKDLFRLKNGDRLVARPVHLWERLQVWQKLNPVRARGYALAIFSALLIFAAFAIYAYHKADAARALQEALNHRISRLVLASAESAVDRDELREALTTLRKLSSESQWTSNKSSVGDRLANARSRALTATGIWWRSARSTTAGFPPHTLSDSGVFAIADRIALRFWSVEDGRPLGSWSIDGPVASLAFDALGQRLALLDETGSIVVKTFPEGEQLARFRRPGARRIGFATRGRLWAQVGETLALIDLASPKSSAFQGQGRLIAIADQQALVDQDGAFELWTLGSGDPRVRRWLGPKPVRDLENGLVLCRSEAGWSLSMLDRPATRLESAALNDLDDNAALAFGPRSSTWARLSRDGQLDLYRGSRRLTTQSFAAGPAKLRLSHDERRLIVLHRSGVLELWDTVRSSRLGALTGHGDEVRGLGFYGAEAVWSAGADGSLRLWGPRGLLRSSAFLGEGLVEARSKLSSGVALVGFSDGSAGLWELAKNRWVWRDSGPGAVTALAIDNGSRAFAIARGRHLALRGARRADLALKEGQLILSLAFDTEGALYVGTEDGELSAWRGSPMRRFATCRLASRAVTSLTVSAAVGSLLAGLSDGQFVLFDGQRPLQVLRGDSEFGWRTAAPGVVNLSAAAYDPEGRRFAFGARTSQVVVWAHTRFPGRQRAYEGHEGPVTTVAFSPDGRFVASGASDGTVIVRDLELTQASVIQTLPFTPLPNPKEPDPFRHTASANQGFALARRKELLFWDPTTRSHSRLADAHRSSIVALWGLEDGRYQSVSATGQLRTWNSQANAPIDEGALGFGLQRAAASHSRSLLALVDDQNQLRIVDLSTLKTRWAQALQERKITALGWSREDRVLLLGDAEGSISFWSPKGERWAQFRGHSSGVYELTALSEALMASVGRDRKILLWDTQRLAAAELFNQHQQPIWGATYDSKRGIYASCGKGGAIYLWDATTRRRLFTLRGFPNGVSSLSLSRNGRWILAAGYYRDVMSWDLERLFTVFARRKATVPEHHWRALFGEQPPILEEAGFRFAQKRSR